MTDPIADMLAAIKNAYAVNKREVIIPASQVKEAIAKTLQKEGYIASCERISAKPQDTLKLTLRYVGKNPALSSVKRTSKPGRRVYIRATDIGSTLGGFGLKIISTSKGLLTNKEAIKAGIGGEVICEVY
jgi:small subunit ribosomal protein S8